MEPILVKVEDAAGMLGIGRSKVWELIGAGELPTVRIGRACRVPVSAIHEYAQRQLERAQHGTDAT